MTDYNKVVNYENKVEVIKEEMQEFIAFISEQLKTEKRKDLNIQHRLGMKIMQVLRKWRTLDEHDVDRKSTRLNSSHSAKSRMPSSA